jgi:hypothetical protein
MSNSAPLFALLDFSVSQDQDRALLIEDEVSAFQDIDLTSSLGSPQLHSPSETIQSIADVLNAPPERSRFPTTKGASFLKQTSQIFGSKIASFKHYKMR